MAADELSFPIQQIDMSTPDIFVHAADTFVIPSPSECIIPETFRQYHLAETTGLIEPSTQVQPRYNLCGASAIVSVSPSSLVPFRLTNPTQRPVKSNRHAKISIFLPQQDVVANIVSLAGSSLTPDPQPSSNFVQTKNNVVVLCN